LPFCSLMAFSRCVPNPVSAGGRIAIQFVEIIWLNLAI
jgi:hypothetical protein